MLTGEASTLPSQRVVPVPPPPPGKGSAAPARPAPLIGALAASPVHWQALLNRELGVAFLASFVFHAVLLSILGLLLLRAAPGSLGHGRIGLTGEQPAPASPAGTAVREIVLTRPVRGTAIVAALAEPANRPEAKGDSGRSSEGGKRKAEVVLPNSEPRIAHSELSVDAPAGADLLATHDVPVAGSLAARDIDTRATSAARGGGNVASERAVESGLRWLVAHQQENGSWHFDFDGGTCHGQCRNPGSVTTTTGATALALLPFLGAGYTHKKGEYRENVVRGLYYLNTRTQFTPNGGDVREGTLYSQGLAGIVLAEAYAMSGDHELRGFAQSVLDFIVYSQDKNGGGWRYEPGAPGDTTVSGWQLMALKCGQMAGLRVSKPALYMVTRFLDHVQADDGACYGYMTPHSRTPESKATTTAIGLLCRMYTGWRRNHPTLIAGVANLTHWGPSHENIYYDYYATQVLYHRQGPEWEAWNRQLRDYLVATQSTTGHESGSWYFPGGHGDKGGRLFGTAMAIMTLEVYYRYLPLYSHESVSGF
jgi:hypothetical protein